MRSFSSMCRGLGLLLAAVALIVAAWLYVDHGRFVLDRMANHLDFESFWLSTKALLGGHNIYTAHENLNPPVLTVVLAPLGLLEFSVAYRLFALITVVLVIASMAAVATELRVRPTVAVPVTVAVLLSSPVLATLGLGQIYCLLMAGLVVAWIGHRHERFVMEGAAIGMVMAVKPSLVPLLLLPAVRRRWSTLAAGLGTGLAATLIGIAAAGLSSWSSWTSMILSHPVQTYFDNASLPATILRLTSPNPWGRPLLLLPADSGYPIGLALGAALIACTTWMVRRPPTAGPPDTALWALAAASLLASPLTWHNYLMVLMPGLLVLLVRGEWQLVALLLSLALIGVAWPQIWYSSDGTAPALPLSLYCGILIAYWAALVSTAGITRCRETALPMTQHAATVVTTPLAERPGQEG